MDITQAKKLNKVLESEGAANVEFLRSILKIPSVTGNEGPVQQYIAQELHDMNLTVDVFDPDIEELKQHPAYVATEADSYEGRPNVVGIWKGTGGGKSLLLNGHVDVIPEGAAENWEYGCWSADIADGKIYARGAADMKSGVAAMTMAVRCIQRAGLRLKGDVLLEYVMDEELSGNGTLACVTRGYSADAGICCETSSMCVQPGSIGRIWFTIHVRGKTAGIQQHYEGVNAIDLGYLVNKAVTAFEEKRTASIQHPLYPDIRSSIPCMIGQFESGSYASAFPDSCVMKGSLATVPGEDSEKVKLEFTEFVIQTVQKQEPWFIEHPPEVCFEGYFAEPAAIPENAAIVQTLCREYRHVLGKEPKISGRTGAADIRHLITYGHTPTVIFGPGMTEQMHANNEWVRVRDYLDAIDVLAHTIVDWCEISE